MCIMASPVQSVTDTRIFVGRDVGSARQLTVYSMSVQLQTRTGKGNAMILPVPVGPAGVSAIELVDMSRVPDFFDPFVEAFIERSRGFSLSKGITNDADSLLEVVRVGNYDVSLVPTVDDIKRLNRDVFDVSPDTEHTLRTEYGYGMVFLVAQLRESGNFHPLAYIHPFAGTLFVPTRHEHGKGGSGDLPRWDHQIFYQGSADPDPLPRDHRNQAFRRTISGEHANLYVRGVQVMLRSAPSLLPFVREGLPLSRVKAQGPLPNMDLAIPA